MRSVAGKGVVSCIAAYFCRILYTTYAANMGTMRAELPTELTIRVNMATVMASMATFYSLTCRTPLPKACRPLRETELEDSIFHF